ncbi:hypothetical protein [Natrinema salsiterrestre]|uniref:Uncharacterized protein n=1 Tax=Natrinema salsiterrestre TaxID=2950540 RepID=A0A9Q4L0R9_9EURY|nr:hypothetical protein [Natrinema salsiterrestre]MDF9747880.1 hypothetical protein [Natrinema salsiterrestre]
MDSPPSGWNMHRFGEKSVRFSNNAKRIEVGIKPISRAGKTSQSDTNSARFVIHVHQDRSGEGTFGNRNMQTSVKDWNKAVTTIYAFMEEFNAEQAALPPDEVESVHRSLDDVKTAEAVLSATTAAEALTDAAGYTDELLLNVLATETNNQCRLVAHRQGSDVNTIHQNLGSGHGTISIATIHAAFPVDALGVKTILDAEMPIAITTHVGKHTIYRFIFGDNTETDIVLPRGIQLVTPEFERTVMNVLDEKWT